MSDSLAGSWTAQVARPSGVQEVVFHFTANGMAFLIDGGVGAGGGTWLHRRGRVSFRVKEPVVDDAGVYQGYIDIQQSGQVTVSSPVVASFVTSGESNVYDATDALLYTRTVQITAVRQVLLESALR